MCVCVCVSVDVCVLDSEAQPRRFISQLKAKAAPPASGTFVHAVDQARSESAQRH